ncbi:hypothetical protein AVEN_137392-1 [Araneus ventricosus]|uniref:Uncharacterized protein n=1 Tax=Araneus ventricosus TaxID=182803 RepID=A0A4Y2AKK4_ARAVE|nr:hypothetical protein AVEN_137392-1 [Araneus ventricosus]
MWIWRTSWHQAPPQPRKSYQTAELWKRRPGSEILSDLNKPKRSSLVDPVDLRFQRRISVPTVPSVTISIRALLVASHWFYLVPTELVWF